jgi:hypothetical protein
MPPTTTMTMCGHCEDGFHPWGHDCVICDTHSSIYSGLRLVSTIFFNAIHLLANVASVDVGAVVVENCD